MRISSRFYEKAVKRFKKAFKDIFADDVILEDVCCRFSSRGYFKITYKYLPLNYSIIIENERMRFNIRIEDEDGATNFLYVIEKHDNALEYKNIKNAVFLLKKVLSDGRYVLYLYKEQKLYEKDGDKLKLIKILDIMEKSIEKTLKEIHDIFIKLGFTEVKVNGVDMFQYNEWYYHIDYVDEYKSIVIETTDNYEYAKNRAMEDDDWYDLTDPNVLSIF